MPKQWVLLGPHNLEEPNMQAITTIGLDIAKSVFQVHGVAVDGQVVIRPGVFPEVAAVSRWH